ncbi:MAG TPA: MobF family relaxase [Acidimicrobiales bacterium]|nr:MobF family relaxase [Acidimicrobiales bacterium]
MGVEGVMLNVGKLAAGAAEYFLGEVATSPDAYYTGAKEAPGYWCGSLAPDLGLVGQVDPDDFRALLAGLDPRSGEALVNVSHSVCRRRTVKAGEEWLTPGAAAERLGVSARHVRRLIAAGEQGSSVASLAAEVATVGRSRWRISAAEVARYAATQAPKARRPGYDLAFRPPKSVSVAWALGDEGLREVIREAHREAVTAALAYLEDQAAAARSGRGRSRVATDGYVAAAFDHRTSRAGDPLLHTHVVVANLTRLADGTWRALDSRGIFRHARTAGFLYQAHLRHLLSTRLGAAWEPVRNGWADLAGSPAILLSAFSKRRADIEAAVAEAGASSARAYQAATLITRPRKDHQGGPLGLEDRWAAEAADLGVDENWLDACVGHAVPVAPSHDVMLALLDELGGPRGLTERASTFDRRDVIRALCERAGPALAAEALVCWADRFLASPRVVVLAPTSAGATRRFSTPELVALEARLLTAAEVAPSRLVPSVDDEVLADVLAAHPMLSDEQRAMVESVCGSTRAVLAVTGHPGSGKTAATAVCVEALVASGVPVVGCSLSATAAAELEAATGLGERTGRPASTIARLLVELDDPVAGGLAPGSVVLIDEASLAPTRLVARLLDHVERAGGALRLVGDPDQHGSVEAGGLFAALVARSGDDVVVLRANHRQCDPVERHAIDAYRQGQVADAVASYDAAGKLTRSPSAAVSYDAMATTWFARRRQGGRDPMIVGTNSARAELNARARALLVTAGELEGPSLVVAGREFQVGDEVVARRNDRRLRGAGGDFVKNGSVGRVAAVDLAHGELLVAFTNEGEVRLPAAYLSAGAVEHAYARTTYGLQGATLDAALYHPGDASSFEEGYVAITRARHSTELFVVEGQVDDDDESHGAPGEVTDLDAVVGSLSRRGAGRLAHDEDGSAADGISLTGATLGQLAARRAEIEDTLAGEPPAVDLALAGAQRTLKALLERRRSERSRQAVDRGSRRRTQPGWLDAAIARAERTVADLSRRQVERAEWRAEHAPELHEREVLRRAAASRREQLAYGMRAGASEPIIDRLGPRPRRPGPARRWEEAAIKLAVGLDGGDAQVTATESQRGICATRNRPEPAAPPDRCVGLP